MWLKVVSGLDAGRTVEIVPRSGTTFVLGRVRGSDLVVRDERASRRHAELRPLPDGRLELRDLESANGTYVDGEPVNRAVLDGGERLRIGAVELAVLTEAAELPAAAASEPFPAAPPPAWAAARPPTYSMVGRMIEHRTRAARRTTWVALLAALLAILAATVVAATGFVRGDDDVPAVVRRMAGATVLVEALSQGRRSTGSGWVLDEREGLVVTNAHVINEGVQFRVAAGGRRRQAAILAAAPCEDLAVLRVTDTAGLGKATLGAAATVEQGESVVALGYPAGASSSDALSSTRGVVSVARASFPDPAPDVPSYQEAILTDTALNPGNSGGPLVDLDGRVVGVNSATRTAGSDGRPLEGQGYAIAIDRVRRVVDELRHGRSRGWTGATFGYPTVQQLADRRLPPGLYLTGAVSRTPAARAGIGGHGELLIGVNGQSVGASLSSYCAVARGMASGSPITLTLADPDHGRIREVRLRMA